MIWARESTRFLRRFRAQISRRGSGSVPPAGPGPRPPLTCAVTQSVHHGRVMARHAAVAMASSWRRDTPGADGRRYRRSRAHHRDRHRTCRQRRAGTGAHARARVHHLAGDEGQRARGLGLRRRAPRRRRPAPQRAQGRRHRRHPRPDGARARPLHPAHRRAGGPDRPADHRRHRPVHVQRAAPLLAGADPGQRARRQRPDGEPVRQGHHRGHRRHGDQGRRHQVRHRPPRRHARRRAGAAGVRPDPSPHRVPDHHAHVRRRSPRPRAAGDLQGGGRRPDPGRHRPQRRHRRPRLPRGADRQRLDPRHGPLRHRRDPADRRAGQGHRRAVRARLRRPHGAEPRRVVLPRLDPRRDPAVDDGRTGTTCTSARTSCRCCARPASPRPRSTPCSIDTPRRFLENRGAY